MNIIREKLNNYLKIESKEIRKNFYDIEKRTNNYIQYKIIHKSPSQTTIYTIYFCIELLARFIIFLKIFMV